MLLVWFSQGEILGLSYQNGNVPYVPKENCPLSKVNTLLTKRTRWGKMQGDKLLMSAKERQRQVFLEEVSKGYLTLKQQRYS
jgi:hypothetical protein